MTVIFISPVAITDSVFVSSTRAENDYTAWSGATTYAAGDRCILVSTHRIYQSVQAGNLNHDPATDAGTWWVAIGATNRWCMFDQSVGSVTSQATPLTVVLHPGDITASLALLDLDGTSVDVSMTDGLAGPSVYSKSYDITDDATLASWWDYFFAPLTPATTLIVNDLPAYSNGYVSVTINAATTARCGTMVVGNGVEVGSLRAGVQVGIIDYSKKTTDDYGVTSILERAFAKRIEADVLITNAQLDYISTKFAEIRAIPVVWSFDSAYDCLQVYGWVKDWSATIIYRDYSEKRLTIEGLV